MIVICRSVATLIAVIVFGIIHHGFLQTHVYTLRVQPFATRHFKQRTSDVAPYLGGAWNTGHAEASSAACDFYVEAAFDLSQVFIKLSAKIGETVVIGGLQDDILGYLYGVQCRGTDLS